MSKFDSTRRIVTKLEEMCNNFLNVLLSSASYAFEGSNKELSDPDLKAYQ